MRAARDPTARAGAGAGRARPQPDAGAGAPRSRRRPAPAPAAARTGGGAVAIDVRALAVTDGVIDYRSFQVGEAGARGPETPRPRRRAVDSRRGAPRRRSRARPTRRSRVRGGQARRARRVRSRGPGAARRPSARVVRGVGLDADGSLDGDADRGAGARRRRRSGRDRRALARDFGLDRDARSRATDTSTSTCGGTLAAPSLRVSARFPALAFAETRAQDLDGLRLDSRPRRARRAGPRRRARRRSRWARSSCDRPRSRCTPPAGASTVHAAIAAPQPLPSTSAARARPGDRRTLAIDALSIRYPEATWTLRRRARLSFGGRRSRCPASSSAPTRSAWRSICALGGARAGPRTSSSSRLDLGAAAARAGAAGARPRRHRRRRRRRARRAAPARAAHRRDGGAGGRPHPRPPQPVARRPGAALERGRASGAICARAGWHRGDRPLRSSGRVAAAQPARADRSRRRRHRHRSGGRRADDRRCPGREAPPRVKGRARVSIKARRPRRASRALQRRRSRGAGWRSTTHSVGDLALTVSGEGDGQLAARLTSTAPVPHAHRRHDAAVVAVDSPPSARPPRRWRARRSRSRARSIGCRSRCSRAPRAVPRASAARCRRSWPSPARRRSPEGTVAIDVAGATAERFPPTDARIELDFDGRAVDGARPRRPQAAPAARRSRRASACRSAACLHRRAARGRAAARCARWSDRFAMQRLGLPPESDREPPRALKGRLHADLTVDGTIGAPRVLFHAQASDLRLDKIAGRLRADRGDATPTARPRSTPG